jgi:peptide/nickel transport system permease protein
MIRAQSLQDLKFVIGAICIGTILFLAAGGGLLTPFDANEQDLLSSQLPPGADGHLFGTDHLGRDIFARVVSGSRISVVVASAVVLISGVFGVLVGALSGYWGGWRDVVIQKFVETIWAFPAILLALAILAFFGQSLVNLVLALSIQRWIPYCRIARAQALVLRNREYIAAARVLGGGTVWIIGQHLLPNLISSSIVIATFSMATSILAEASLSFLGLGVPPGIPTWGGMLAEGRSYVTGAWWIAVFPGLAIFLTVLGLNLLGDWCRDLLDPKKTLNLR